MTTGIFSRALDHAYIRFDQVMLLILDECHHAVGDSGMNKVRNNSAPQLSANFSQALVFSHPGHEVLQRDSEWR